MSNKDEFINDVKSFLSVKKLEIDSILSRLNWDEETLMQQNNETVQCSYNCHHILPKQYAAKHYSKCSWTTDGYLPDEKPLSLPTHTGEDTIKIDSLLLNEIFQNSKFPKDHRQIPKTSNRHLADFTPEERLKLYNYTIEHTKFEMPDEIPLDFNTNKEENEEPSFLELKAMERDAKRRRISYKNRNIYTKNKSHVEVLRDVIKNQMETYEEWIKSQFQAQYNKSIEKIEHHSTILPDTESYDKDFNNYKPPNTDTKYFSKDYKEPLNINQQVDTNLSVRKKRIDEEYSDKKDYYNVYSHSRNEYDNNYDRKYQRSSSYSRKRKRSYSCSSSEEDLKEKYTKKHKKHSKHHKRKQRSDSQSNEEDYYKYKKKHKKEKKSKKRKHSRN